MALLLTMFLSLFHSIYAQPAFVYDGTSTQELIGGTGQANWTLKYPLGLICEDQNWRKKLTITITATSNEADLVFAFGTPTDYFAVAMAWDNTLCVPLGKKDDPILPEENRCDAVFVTPRTGSPLQPASPSLEMQYATSTDFREALVQGNNHTKEWQVLVEQGNGQNPWLYNANELILDIVGDRKTLKTILTMYKNGANATIEMGSTWGIGQNVFLFFGLDSIHEERFTLSSITSEDDCSWKPAPTPPPTLVPTGETDHPSFMPSVDPTIPSRAPSEMPSSMPTLAPSQPTNGPTIMPSKNPSTIPTESTSAPTSVPTETTMNPTSDPTVLFTDAPTETTMLPTLSPSFVPTQSVINVGGVTPSVDPTSLGSGESAGAKEATIIDGVDNLYLYIGIGVAAVLLIAFGLFLLYTTTVNARYKQAKQMEEAVKDSAQQRENDAWANSIYGD